MIVPTSSPATTRATLASASSKTWIARRLSMQSESAVVSITLRPRSIASQVRDPRQELGVGSRRGSPS